MGIIRTIDKIRVENGISVDSFIEGICSRSTYYNYLNNDTAIPNEKIKLFSIRLGVTEYSLSYTHRRSNDHDSILINNLAMALYESNLDKAKIIIGKTSRDDIENPIYLLSYDFYVQKFNFKSKNITLSNYYNEVLNIYKELKKLSNLRPITKLTIIHELIYLERQINDKFPVTLDGIELISNLKQPIDYDEIVLLNGIFVGTIKYFIKVLQGEQAIEYFHAFMPIVLQYGITLNHFQAYHSLGNAYLINNNEKEAINAFKKSVYHVGFMYDEQYFNNRISCVIESLEYYGYKHLVEDFSKMTF